MLWERGKRYNEIVQNLKYVDDTVLALGISKWAWSLRDRNDCAPTATNAIKSAHITFSSQ